ncbi:hypothetical protein Pmani_017178 [Petrolisthes manimaculis]|uniref:Ig-like domain-containing protein n=1 Tax=Petrolisthes manimaculis TaxID=1843537 RepID=A0AAE1PQ21_9EUCA|nr:hypothetical protein Pmani_017178 [Petrolisthes manimaculis]
MEGDVVHLRCHYQDEGGSSLYTLKWYKDDQEFYRHQPGLSQQQKQQQQQQQLEQQQTQQHKHNHNNHNNAACLVSTERDLVLRGVTTNTTGEYKCEAIGEHPNFRKEIKKAWLTVYKEPLRPPQLSGWKDSYSPLDHIHLNCTSINTEYTPTLTFLINGHPVNESVLRAVGASTTKLVLSAHDAHFPQGVMTVACVASLGNAHTAATRRTLYTSHYLTAQEYLYNGGDTKRTGTVVEVWALKVVLLVMVLMEAL